MVKVEMPRAQWEIVLTVLADRNNSICDSVYFDIDKQVYSQEY